MPHRSAARQMLVHLAVPIGQQFQRALAFALDRALGGIWAGEPQIRADQRQQAPPRGGGGDGIELRGNQALAGVDLTLAQKQGQPLDPLGIAQA